MVQEKEFRIQGSSVWNLRVRVLSFRFRVSSAGIRV
jgi:hypothetical protein